MKNQVGFSYKMRNEEPLYIISNRPLTEEEREDILHEPIDDLYYQLSWKENVSPVSFTTQIQAMEAAIGAQWVYNL